MDLREVAAAYQSLYNINEEVLEEDINIDDLSQEDVDELVEELVYEFLEEGYSIAVSYTHLTLPTICSV